MNDKAFPRVNEGTVLLVDDDPVMSQVARRLLEERLLHVEVLSCPDGPAALALMAKRRVDVVVADFRMPGLDGMQLLQAVRDHWPTVGRILLTASDDLQLAVRAVNESLLDHYLLKPVRGKELAQAVADALVRGLRRRLEHDILQAQDQVLKQALELARSLREPAPRPEPSAAAAPA